MNEKDYQKIITNICVFCGEEELIKVPRYEKTPTSKFIPAKIGKRVFMFCTKHGEAYETLTMLWIDKKQSRLTDFIKTVQEDST